MRRIVGLALLVLLAGACGSSGKVADPTRTRVLPGYGGHQNLAIAKQQGEVMVKEDPRNKFAWYNLGVIAEGAHDTVTAQTDYLKAIAIDPSFESALYKYGHIRYDAADYPRAISYLRRAVTANDKDANALWYLGLALRIPDTPASDAEAVHFLNAALKLDPTLIRTLKPLTGSGGTGAA